MRKLFVPILVLTALFAAADQQKALKKLNEAERAFAVGNLSRAEKSVRDAIKEDPKSVPAQALLGDILSLTRRHSLAADAFTAALKADDEQRALSPEQRRGIINQQGVAHGMGGNLDRAEEIFKQAIQRDPDYPLFHYNLGAVFAEKKQLEPALEHLKNAWKIRANMPSGEPFPDPRKDSSFAPYLNDRRFQDAVREMVF